MVMTQTECDKKTNKKQNKTKKETKSTNYIYTNYKHLKKHCGAFLHFVWFQH